MMNLIRRAWNGVDRNMKMHYERLWGRQWIRLGQKETERNCMDHNAGCFAMEQERI